MSGKRGVDFVRAIVKYMANDGSFGTVCLKNIDIIEGGGGKVLAEFKVLPEHLNSAGALHGGFIAALMDMLTTSALATHSPPPPQAGVSVDLRVSYMKAAKEGDYVIVDAKTVKAGRKITFLECEMKHKSDGSLIAKGGQTQYLDYTLKGDYYAKF
uniref:Acyl-coenzyme A thioesterase 13 n=1 Tax=Nyssomyia neivai TaxID=330878 RepID=A0A1L8DZA9_9DIPT